MDDFPSLETLSLSFNKLNYMSIQALMNIRRLKVLDLTANSIVQLPSDMSKFAALEEINLTDNNLGHKSKDTGCTSLLKTLGQMPRLKRLNLSRNKIVRLASDLLKGNTDFLELQEIDVSFNWLDDERNLWFLSQTRGVNLVIITGNPFASRSGKNGAQNDYEALENELAKNLSAVVINDVGLVDENGFYLKRKAGQQRPML